MVGHALSHHQEREKKTTQRDFPLSTLAFLGMITPGLVLSSPDFLDFDFVARSRIYVCPFGPQASLIPLLTAYYQSAVIPDTPRQPVKVQVYCRLRSRLTLVH